MSDSDLRKAAQAALEAMESLLAKVRRDAPQLSGKLMGHCESVNTQLRAALAQPERQAATCEWTNCPTRVGDRCCNEAAQPEQQAEPVAWLRVSNISQIASGAFLPGELGGVELRSERLVPLMIVPGKNAS